MLKTRRTETNSNSGETCASLSNNSFNCFRYSTNIASSSPCQHMHRYKQQQMLCAILVSKLLAVPAGRPAPSHPGPCGSCRLANVSGRGGRGWNGVRWIGPNRRQDHQCQHHRYPLSLPNPNPAVQVHVALGQLVSFCRSK